MGSDDKSYLSMLTQKIHIYSSFEESHVIQYKVSDIRRESSTPLQPWRMSLRSVCLVDGMSPTNGWNYYPRGQEAESRCRDQIVHFLSVLSEIQPVEDKQVATSYKFT